MTSKREQLDLAIQNMANGTLAAADLKRQTRDPEVEALAKAVHLIGYGAQQVALALRDDA